jgi:carbonic anhydrase
MSKVSHVEGIPFKLSRHVILQDLLPHEMNYFYRYAGSLTTPNCDESVLWTILVQPVPVGEEQVISQQTNKIIIDLLHIMDYLVQCLQ